MSISRCKALCRRVKGLSGPSIGGLTKADFVHCRFVVAPDLCLQGSRICRLRYSDRTSQPYGAYAVHLGFGCRSGGYSTVLARLYYASSSLQGQVCGSARARFRVRRNPETWLGLREGWRKRASKNHVFSVLFAGIPPFFCSAFI